LWFSNICGIFSNFEALCHRISVDPNPPELILLNETLIDPATTPDTAYSIPSYTQLRFDRSTNAGGNIVYYRSNLAVSVVRESPSCEYVWLKIRTDSGTLLLAHCYRKPASSPTQIFDLLSDDLIDLEATYPSALFGIVGDLNVHLRDWLRGTTCLDNDAGRACFAMSLAHDLHQLVSTPTRSYSFDGEVHRFSTPDVMLVDTPDSFRFVGTAPHIGNADHALVKVGWLVSSC
jgi:hypothetical protein